MPGIAELIGFLSSATEEGHHGVDWFVLGSTITNALLFFGFLAYKLKPMVSSGLSARRDNMASKLEEARLRQIEAERRLKAYADKLDNLEREVEAIVKGYEAEAQAEVKRLEEETARAIVRLERETEFTVRQEIRKAEKLIMDAMIAATLRAAERIVSERITDADKRRLADQYISSLETPEI